MPTGWSKKAWSIDNKKPLLKERWEYNGILVCVNADEIHVEDRDAWTPKSELPEPIVMILGQGHAIYKSIEIITYLSEEGLLFVVKPAKDNNGKCGFFGISCYGSRSEGRYFGISESYLRHFERWLECLRDIEEVFPSDYEFPKFGIEDTPEWPKDSDKAIGILQITGRLYKP